MKRFVNLFIVLIVITIGCSKKPITKSVSRIDTVEYHRAQGFYYLKHHNYDEAFKSFDRSLKLNTKDYLTMSGMAIVKAMQLETKKAIKLAKKSLSIKDNSFTRMALGRVYYHVGDLKKALKQLDKAIKKNNTNAEAYFYRSLTYYHKKEYSFSNKDLLKSISLDPNNETYSKTWNRFHNERKIKSFNDIGDKIIKIKELTRADVAALLIHELTLDKRISRVRRFEDNNTFIPYDENGSVEAIIYIKDIANNWAKAYIKRLLAVQLPGLELDYNGYFYPERKITRAHWAIILQNVLALVANNKTLLTKYYGEDSHIPGIRSDHPSYNALMICIERGLMNPRLDGRIDMNETIGGVEALKAINKLKTVLDFRSDSTQ